MANHLCAGKQKDPPQFYICLEYYYAALSSVTPLLHQEVHNLSEIVWNTVYACMHLFPQQVCKTFTQFTSKSKTPIALLSTDLEENCRCFLV